MNYLVIGDDEYIKETEISRIKKKFLSPDEAQLNYSVHDTDDMNSIMDSLNTMPFLASKRIVWVKEVQTIASESMDTILAYLEKPLETSILILSAANTFKKTKAFRELSKLVEIIKADKVDSLTIKKWIQTFFKKEEVNISPAAVELIVKLKGTDAIGVKSELEKLICFSGGEQIEVSHVEQLIGRSVTETIFKLIDAINTGNAKWAFSILNDLYDQKKQPHEVIGYLSWYIRIMQKVTLLSNRGIDSRGIATELKYSPAYTRMLVNQSRKYSPDKINRWVTLLLEADRDIKTGRRQPQVAVEMILSSVMG